MRRASGRRQLHTAEGVIHRVLNSGLGWVFSFVARSAAFRARSIGGTLKKLLLASFVLGAAFAISPTAFAGSSNGSDSNNAPTSEHNYSAANGSSHSNDRAPKGPGNRVEAAVTLAPTSESRSLLLLGVGLLSFASAVFILKDTRKPTAQ